MNINNFNALFGEAKSASSRALLFEFFRYFFASLVALLVDMFLLIALAQYIHYAAAATIGFISGAAIHYGISITFVFQKRKIRGKKHLELLMFFVIGGGALVVNVALIAFCVEFFLSPLPVAKLVAAGGSFAFGYIVRKLALF